MKIATLLLFSVMMMSPSATLFSWNGVGRAQSTGDQTHRRRSQGIGAGRTVGTAASRHQMRLEGLRSCRKGGSFPAAGFVYYSALEGAK